MILYASRPSREAYLETTCEENTSQAVVTAQPLLVELADTIARYVLKRPLLASIAKRRHSYCEVSSSV